MEHFYVKCGDPSCLGLLDIVRKKNIDKQKVKTLPPPLPRGVNTFRAGFLKARHSTNSAKAMTGTIMAQQKYSTRNCSLCLQSDRNSLIIITAHSELPVQAIKCKTSHQDVPCNPAIEKKKPDSLYMLSYSQWVVCVNTCCLLFT